MIGLRDRIIPVIDLRVKFGLGAPASGDRSCIVILESDHAGQAMCVGVAVDSVSEVWNHRWEHLSPSCSITLPVMRRKTQPELTEALFPSRALVVNDDICLLGAFHLQPGAHA